MHRILGCRLTASLPPHLKLLQLGTPFNITLEAPHVVDMRRQVGCSRVG